MDEQEPHDASFCKPGKWHQYDHRSGYCIWGCGNREDGRIVSYLGTVIAPGPDYSPARLAALVAEADARDARRR